MKSLLVIFLYCLVPAGWLCAQEKKGVALHQDQRLAILLNNTKTPNTGDNEDEEAAEGSSKKTGKKLSASDKQPKYVYEPVNNAKSIADEIKEYKKTRASDPVVKQAKPTTLAPSGERITSKYISSYSGGGKYTGPGYRVQIYYGTNRYEALRRKAEFMRNYPTINTYFTYISPNYRVKIGDFRRREDATGMYREANGTYSPCMIVPDKVNIK